MNGKGGTHLHPSVGTAGAAGLRRLVAGSSAGSLVVLLLLWLLLLGLGDGLRVLLVLVHGPVEDVVVLEALANKEITEDLAEV